MSENLDYKTLWEKALAEIRTEVDEQTFTRWLNIDYTSCSENTITAAAPSSVHIDQINTRFPRIFEKKIKELSGQDICVLIEPCGKPLPLPVANITENSGKQSRKSVEIKPSPKIKLLPDSFNSEFTFENYIIGDNNYFAVSVAQAISENPGIRTEYNPFTIYGGVGLGKTHLMQAIGNYAHNHSDCKIIYVTGEEFLNEFVDSVKTGKMPSFKRKYRFADLLLLDDIQIFEKKTECCNELFNIFNALQGAKKQMVFTCDRPVSELKNITDRLQSRLGSGVQVDIINPNYETRMAILKKKAESSSTEIPPEVLELICKNVSSNTRDMLGALHRLIAFSDLIKKPITLDIAQGKLKDIFASPKQMNISIDNIIQIVGSHFDVSVSDIKGKKRKQNTVFSRQIAMYLARELTEFSLQEIGESFGGKDHTTVIYTVEKIEQKIEDDPSVETMIENLKKRIKESSIK